MYAHGEACRPDKDRADSGAYCPTRSMAREPYDGIIGAAPVGAVPLGRVATVRGSLRRHAYTAMAEAMMSRRRSRAKPEGLSQLNLNAAGIDVGATSHYVAVPADRGEPPVREFEAFTADLYRLADWLSQCGVETVVMESTGVYWITAVRGTGGAGLPGDAGGPPAHQERARPQDRRGGLPVAAAAAHLRPAVGGFPARRGGPALAQLPAAAGHAGAVRLPPYPAYAEGADPDEREAPSTSSAISRARPAWTSSRPS